MLHVWRNQRVENPKLLLNLVKTKLKVQYEHTFFQKLNSDIGANNTSGNKLRTYKIVKSQYVLEHYMKLNLPRNVSTAIAKVRLSAHDLEIERGRRTKPKPTPVHERLCKFCNLNSVEDEIHFVTTCPFYNVERCKLFELYGFKNPVINTYSEKEIFVFLFKNQERHKLLELGKFLENSFIKRLETTT